MGLGYLVGDGVTTTAQFSGRNVSSSSLRERPANRQVAGQGPLRAGQAASKKEWGPCRCRASSFVALVSLVKEQNHAVFDVDQDRER
jgi:hypothetical protein